MEQVAVVYCGPSGAYSVEHDGKWFEFQVGKRLAVPEELAERLLDAEGHDFELGDKAPSPLPTPPIQPVKKGPDGVNADLP